MKDGWFYIGQTNSGFQWFYKLSSLKRNYNNAEFWVKIIPLNPVKYTKGFKQLKNLAFSLHFMTIDCDGKRISTENKIFYDRKGKILLSDNSYLSRMNAEPIVPDSFGETIWGVICKNYQPLQQIQIKP